MMRRPVGDQSADLLPPRSRAEADSTEKRGYPPYDPRLMPRPLIHGYTTGVRMPRHYADFPNQSPKQSSWTSWTSDEEIGSAAPCTSTNNMLSDQHGRSLWHLQGSNGVCSRRVVADRPRLAPICRSPVYVVTMSEYSRPMQEPTLLLLTALADEPRHGYALMQEVAEISGGRVRLRTGTLYGALDRLQREGLVLVVREEIVDGRARKVYALAESGRTALAQETVRLRAITEEAERRLAPRPHLKGATA
jgi:DNA-binding PadR family transcriptional regulator